MFLSKSYKNYLVNASFIWLNYDWQILNLVDFDLVTNLDCELHIYWNSLNHYHTCPKM